MPFSLLLRRASGYEPARVAPEYGLEIREKWKAAQQNKYNRSHDESIDGELAALCGIALHDLALYTDADHRSAGRVLARAFRNALGGGARDLAERVVLRDALEVALQDNRRGAGARRGAAEELARWCTATRALAAERRVGGSAPPRRTASRWGALSRKAGTDAARDSLWARSLDYPDTFAIEERTFALSAAPEASDAREPAREQHPAPSSSDEPVASAPEPASSSGGASRGASSTGKWLARTMREVALARKTEYRPLVTQVLSLLQSPQSDEAVQGALLDALGFEHIDTASELLQRRDSIVAFSIEREATLAAMGAATGGRESRAGQFGTGVTVTSESAKQRARDERKHRRKVAKNAVHDDLSELTEAERADFASLLRSNKYEDELFGDDRAVVDVGGGYVMTSVRTTSIGRALPPGARTQQRESYDMVTVPPPTERTQLSDTERIPVSNLSSIAQMAFAGVELLNTVQSVVYDTVYNTPENVLVCAPTGAGKTNVALLSITREVERHISETGMLQRDFKVVYVAPMKALAAEVADTMQRRLRALGATVRELTGDMQLSRREIAETHMLVTTPEKWDVVTRKGSGDPLVSQVKLLILDEVHLLHEDRGPVIEMIAARTIRRIEASQSRCRIVALSATLPNYEDVALFLRVNPERGLFYFDASFRPVPLEQTFIGVKETNVYKRQREMNRIAYTRALDAVQRGHQIMVFVHSRKDTVRTAEALHEMSVEQGREGAFTFGCDAALGAHPELKRELKSFAARELYTLAAQGLAVHHAGLLRRDRNAVERLFKAGAVRVLVCTATLAWGVNLPAHAVIIKGTEVYVAEKGGLTELSMLDVMQIFGRAGRPQFDDSGEASIITSHEQLPRYLSMLSAQMPIESQLISHLEDHLNAEIVLGSVSNIAEAAEWLAYTYLFVRLVRNPTAYGVSLQQVHDDPTLREKRIELVSNAARRLAEARMVRFDRRSGALAATSLGRTASLFYVRCGTIEQFKTMLHAAAGESDCMHVLCSASEFGSMKVRDEETEDLDRLRRRACRIDVTGTPDVYAHKCSILLQAYVSRAEIRSFSLASDTSFVVQSAARIARALFDICLKNGWGGPAEIFLRIAKAVDARRWDDESPLAQFPTIVPADVAERVTKQGLSVDRLRTMTGADIGRMVRFQRYGNALRSAALMVPWVDIDVAVQPITATVARFSVKLRPDFEYKPRFHGPGVAFWLWVEDSENEHVYHCENVLLAEEERRVEFTIPLLQPLPPMHRVRLVADHWIGADHEAVVSLRGIIVPDDHPPYTELLDLQPLPVTALQNQTFESLYPYTHFNAIQTQMFHCLYHTDAPVLLGAPTGSGKTIAAEIAMLRVFRDFPRGKCVYVAPLKSLVRERMRDWKKRLGAIGISVVELTGDVTPDARALARARVLLTTPEKWDAVSRWWRVRAYVRAVRLVVLDEVHLLGTDRGAVLEMIVSRMRHAQLSRARDDDRDDALHAPPSTSTRAPRPLARLVGLSTALANARDVADWLGVPREGLYNFRPSVRPVPVEVHVQGYPGRHYCPRMATMNRPIFQAIREHVPDGAPTLVFVASRRQTRLTALDLISLVATEGGTSGFTAPAAVERELVPAAATVADAALRHALPYGVGLHHAGLSEHDRETVERLFGSGAVRVLVSTATLAWGVNFPARLVIVKGTEFFDAKQGRYVDFPITDVLQMIGRAGRPQFDTRAIAVVMCHEPKKDFYRKFLYEPFPVESALASVLHDHVAAEIAAGSITTVADAAEFLSYTYLFRRMAANPNYYGCDAGREGVPAFLADLIERTVVDLDDAGLVVRDLERPDGAALASARRFDTTLTATPLGELAAYYYLHYRTARNLARAVKEDFSLSDALEALAGAFEFAELPVRHNEDKVNAELAQGLPWTAPWAMDSPHAKTHLLLQAHFCRSDLPSSDYVTDTKSVLDQAVRVVQALLDIAADEGYLETSMCIARLNQMIHQGLWFTDPTFYQLPSVSEPLVRDLHRNGIRSVPELALADAKRLRGCRIPPATKKALARMPLLEVRCEAPREPVAPGERAHILVHLKRKNADPVSLVQSQRFSKRTDDGWYIMLGDVETDELIALRRVSFQSSTTARLEVSVPNEEGVFPVSVFVMSQNYLGLDQEVKIDIHAKGNSRNGNVES